MVKCECACHAERDNFGNPKWSWCEACALQHQEELATEPQRERQLPPFTDGDHDGKTEPGVTTWPPLDDEGFPF
jgi:hypothetical protein